MDARGSAPTPGRRRYLPSARTPRSTSMASYDQPFGKAVRVWYYAASGIATLLVPPIQDLQ